MTTLTLTLNNGCNIPVLGLGTSDGERKEGAFREAVKEAIKVGYRHIDTAYLYGTEKEIGEAIEDSIKKELVKREELFITTKVWMNYMRPDRVRESVESSLKDLNITYIDLLLIHWPMAMKQGSDKFPEADGKLIPADVKFTDTWKAMETLVDEGVVKSIGVSNFNHKQLSELLESCRIKPTMNQIEVHPHNNNSKIIDFCHAHNIHITAYSPIGTPFSKFTEGKAKVIDEPVVKEIAAKHGKTVTQVLIRYAIDRGLAVIPKSVTPSRIKENFEVLNFKLAEDDVKALNSLNRPDGRIFSHPNFQHLPNYPFVEEF